MNFLVLLWILQRLFYRPVRDAIARRRDAVEKALTDAQAAEARAQELTRQYESRLEDWRKESEAGRARLAEEIATERSQLLALLQDDLAKERDRQGVLERQSAREEQRRLRTEANALAAAFAARFLGRLASAGLDAEIINLVVEDCRTLQADTAQALREALIREGLRAEITSAHPLGPGQREVLTMLLSTLAGEQVALTWHEDASLVAGVSVEIGPWVLQANLRDELSFFGEAGQHVV